MNIPSIALVKECLLNNLLGMSSLTNILAPHHAYFYHDYGCLKPVIINCESGKLEFNLVLVITKILDLLFIISFDLSNLSGNEECKYERTV